jgi:hypothetical protein
MRVIHQRLALLQLLMDIGADIQEEATNLLSVLA